MQLPTIASVPFRLIDQALDFVCRGGSWRLHSYEKQIVEAASVQLSEANKVALNHQLSGFFFAQRLFTRRLTSIHHFNVDSVRKLALPESYCIAKLNATSGLGKMKVSVSILAGHLIEIRFGKDPKGFFSIPYKLVAVEFGGKADQVLQKSANRLERGRGQ